MDPNYYSPAYGYYPAHPATAAAAAHVAQVTHPAHPTQAAHAAYQTPAADYSAYNKAVSDYNQWHDDYTKWYNATYNQPQPAPPPPPPSQTSGTGTGASTGTASASNYVSNYYGHTAATVNSTVAKRTTPAHSSSTYSTGISQAHGQSYSTGLTYGKSRDLPAQSYERPSAARPGYNVSVNVDKNGSKFGGASGSKPQPAYAGVLSHYAAHGIKMAPPKTQSQVFRAFPGSGSQKLQYQQAKPKKPKRKKTAEERKQKKIMRLRRTIVLPGMEESDTETETESEEEEETKKRKKTQQKPVQTVHPTQLAQNPPVEETFTEWGAALEPDVFAEVKGDSCSAKLQFQPPKPSDKVHALDIDDPSQLYPTLVPKPVDKSVTGVYGEWGDTLPPDQKQYRDQVLLGGREPEDSAAESSSTTTENRPRVVRKINEKDRGHLSMTAALGMLMNPDVEIVEEDEDKEEEEPKKKKKKAQVDEEGDINPGRTLLGMGAMLGRLADSQPETVSNAGRNITRDVSAREWGTRPPLPEKTWGSVNPEEKTWGSVDPEEKTWGSVDPAEKTWGSVEPAEKTWGSVDPAEKTWGSVIEPEPRGFGRTAVPPRESGWTKVPPRETGWTAVPAKPAEDTGIETYTTSTEPEPTPVQDDIQSRLLQRAEAGASGDVFGTGRRPPLPGFDGSGRPELPGPQSALAGRPELPGSRSAWAGRPELPGSRSAWAGRPELPGSRSAWAGRPELPGSRSAWAGRPELPGSRSAMSGRPELPGSRGTGSEWRTPDPYANPYPEQNRFSHVMDNRFTRAMDGRSDSSYENRFDAFFAKQARKPLPPPPTNLPTEDLPSDVIHDERFGGKIKSDLVHQIMTSDNPSQTAKKILDNLGKKVDLNQRKDVVTLLSKKVAERTEQLLTQMAEGPSGAAGGSVPARGNLKPFGAPQSAGFYPPDLPGRGARGGYRGAGPYSRPNPPAGGPPRGRGGAGRGRGGAGRDRGAQSRNVGRYNSHTQSPQTFGSSDKGPEDIVRAMNIPEMKLTKPPEYSEAKRRKNDVELNPANKDSKEVCYNVMRTLPPALFEMIEKEAANTEKQPPPRASKWGPKTSMSQDAVVSIDAVRTAAGSKVASVKDNQKVPHDVGEAKYGYNRFVLGSVMTGKKQ